VNTVVVMWLAGSKRSLAWLLGLIGQAGWLAFVILFQAWGLLPLVVVLTVVYTRNLLRWRTEDTDRSESSPITSGHE
jgi:nicotinamide riboside transporter PnuC